MLALNLPGFAPKVAEKDGKRTIFDPVRQKYVALTPEEWVRQHFVNYLITRKSYPKELLANEVLVKLNGTSKRCDTVAYNRFLEPLVIVEYKALTVEAITALRAKCRAANVDYCVLKNTLVKRALENKGIKIDDAILEGPNAFVFGNGDPVSAPKLIKEFITAAEKDKKTSPLTIKAGIMDGAVQSVEEVKALADILPREQLIAKIMGCLNSQATALAYVIQAIADKKAEAGEQ